MDTNTMVVLGGGAMVVGMGVVTVLKKVGGRRSAAKLVVESAVYSPSEKKMKLMVRNAGKRTHLGPVFALRQRMDPVHVTDLNMPLSPGAANLREQFSLLGEAQGEMDLQPNQAVSLSFSLYTTDVLFDAMEVDIAGARMKVPIPTQEMEAVEKPTPAPVEKPAVDESLFVGATASWDLQDLAPQPLDVIKAARQASALPSAPKTVSLDDVLAVQPPAPVVSPPATSLSKYASPIEDVVPPEERHIVVPLAPLVSTPKGYNHVEPHQEAILEGEFYITLSKAYSVPLDDSELAVGRVKGVVVREVNLGTKFVEIKFSKVFGKSYVLEKWVDVNGVMLVKSEHLEAAIQIAASTPQ